MTHTCDAFINFIIEWHGKLPMNGEWTLTQSIQKLACSNWFGTRKCQNIMLDAIPVKSSSFPDLPLLYCSNKTQYQFQTQILRNKRDNFKCTIIFLEIMTNNQGAYYYSMALIWQGQCHCVYTKDSTVSILEGEQLQAEEQADYQGLIPELTWLLHVYHLWRHSVGFKYFQS